MRSGCFKAALNHYALRMLCSTTPATLQHNPGQTLVGLAGSGWFKPTKPTKPTKPNQPNQTNQNQNQSELDSDLEPEVEPNQNQNNNKKEKKNAKNQTLF